MKDSVILVEFNELCPPLLTKWMAQGVLPNFKKFHDSAHVFTTEPCVEEQQYLEPWIQWYSLHTGLSYDQHGVFHLADGPRADFPDIWSVLSDAGIPVGNCGSMNARGFDKPGSYFLADPWCTTEQAYPADLRAFHEFVSFSVREYSNADANLGRSIYTNFLKFMLGHGLGLGTVTAIAKQLTEEKLVDGRMSWKRVAILDQLQFDVFSHYQKTLKPKFATYFANSTAHLQHAYWRNMEPENFEVRPSEGDQKFYGDAVMFGYRKMDALLGRFMRLASDDTTVIFATGLSQQPFLKSEGIGGQRFYRPKNVQSMLDQWGVAYVDVQPTMTHQFQIRCANAEDLEDARRVLATVTCEGKAVFGFDKSEGDSIYIGCPLHEMVDKEARIVVEGRNQTTNFYDFFYMIDATKSGFHHPDGALWVRTGSHNIHREKVSILDVFPTLLQHFGVAAPERQGLEYRGRSLLPQLGVTAQEAAA